MSDSSVSDGRRARGDASRRTVLAHATDLASTEGLDGLTIGRLAEASGIGKSSIATLFGGKQALQLATVAAAREIFQAAIFVPAREQERGLSRLIMLLDRALRYSRERVFSGGCFFAATAADVDSKPGPVRDGVRASLRDWYGYVETQVRRAASAGELDADEEQVEQLAFELIALANEANARSLLMTSGRPYPLAAAAMRERLIAHSADPEKVAALEG